MILLDTCTLLWLAMEPQKLSAHASTTLDQASIVWISAISAFEIAQKHAKGKLLLPLSPREWIETAMASHQLRLLPLDLESAVAAAALPNHHADPFDRLLIATAMHHQLTLVTPDPHIHAYPNLSTTW